ncbi:helix-turn-helix transcriptional regulator [Pseudomonas berkeleyensis]|uniref:Helix-turn-helix transcriptional regulator n=1 Tax=Pseudomonas berkeleyensis TaxID=2726956 RepID=A0A7G5DM43_9PSED|nr:helix-turn-helix transcriptional regulator [Pseudomonas berkeleyensis]QMV62818.1 helix-turn-helix transcriptional regulator [Pseudomonas berkeleyensis]WSO38272.1 helix-turn-helix transcriptional regulator [Pseudomonas berkeleyensis]
MSYEESEPNKEDANSVPFPRAGIGTRIEAIADLFDSRKQAASTAGVAVSTLQRWLAEEGMPAFDSLARLAMAKGASLDWIATGEGDMYGRYETRPAEPAEPEEDKYAYIPLYDARCSSGHGSWNERARVLTHLAFTRYSLRKKGLNPATLSCLRNDGDSMLGLLDDDDTVMIDESRNTLEAEGVYVLMLDDHLYAKRLQRQFDGAIQIISENKAYQPMTVPKERLGELQIIGRAVWAGGWLI